MKKIIFGMVFLLVSSLVNASDYNRNYFGAGYNDDGEGGGITFTGSVELGENFFVRSNLIRTDYEDIDVESLFSFYTVGFRQSGFYVEGGMTRVDVCQYVCGDDSGALLMGGFEIQPGNLSLKVGAGTMEVLEESWTIFEADVGYSFSENLSVHFGLLGLDDLGDTATQLGIRFSW